MWRQESTVNLKNPTLIVSAGAVVAFAAVAGLTAAGAANTGPAVPEAIAAQATTGPIPFTGAPNYRAIVAANRAAVVGITTESKASAESDDNDADDQDQGTGPQSNGRSNPFGDNPLFRFFGQTPNMPRQDETRRYSARTRRPTWPSSRSTRRICPPYT
jgi:hypothetical protein